MRMRQTWLECSLSSERHRHGVSHEKNEDTVRRKKLAATVVRLLPCLKMVTEELYG